MNKDITIVTCYLSIDKSKHGRENYKIWIMNYLSIIKNNNIVIYCNCDRTIRLILELRNNFLNKTKIVKINIETYLKIALYPFGKKIFKN